MGELRRPLDGRPAEDRHLFGKLGPSPAAHESGPAGDSSRQFHQAGDDLFPVCAACGAFPRPELPQRLAGALLLTRTLTPREHAVFQLLGLGYDNRSIARELQISERTVKRYVTAILTKLRLRSRLQAGLSALVLSWFPAVDAPWPEGLMDSAQSPGDDVAAYDTGGDHDL
jgi:DNA-binding CsgD family transcriptional regulator